MGLAALLLFMGGGMNPQLTNVLILPTLVTQLVVGPLLK